MAHFQQAEENIIPVQQAEENITPLSEGLPTPAGSEMVSAQGMFDDVGKFLGRTVDGVKNVGDKVIDGVNKGVQIVEGGAREAISRN